jgi:hypothetical protein
VLLAADPAGFLASCTLPHRPPALMLPAVVAVPAANNTHGRDTLFIALRLKIKVS